MDITKHLEKAEEAVRRKNFEGGIGLFEELLKIQPESYRVRKGLLEAARRRSEYKKSMKALLMASASPHLTAAKAMQSMKKWAQAAAHYQKAVQIDPANTSWCLSLGDCLERATMPEAALAVFEHAAEVDAQNIEALKRSGALQYQKKDFSKAMECYEKALRISPRDQEALKARKNLAAEGILVDKGFERARSSRELIKDKEQQRSLEQSQRVHRSQEEIEEELGVLRKALESDPGDWQALEKIGGLCEKKRDWAGAREAYEAALALQPQSEELKSKAEEMVVKQLDRQIEELSGQEGGQEKIQALEAEKNKIQLVQLERKVEKYPADLGLRYQQGRLFFRVGRIDEAIAALQKAVADPRWKLDGSVLLGQCFFKKGLFDLARKQLEKALGEVTVESVRGKEILYNLGLIAERMGSREEAAGFYSRIYEVDIGYRDVAAKVENLRSS